MSSADGVSIARGVPERRKYRDLCRFHEGSLIVGIIAVTETVAAYNRGWLDSYEEAGHGGLVQVSDDDYDQPCREADGKLWSVGYARAHPVQHPNCKRRFAPPKVRKSGERFDVVGEAERVAAVA